jgi:hypothetical protein
MSSLAHDTTNDQRLNDMMKEVRAFGRDAAEGKDSLPKLAHKVVRAAHEGIIDTNKDADNKDAAWNIYTAYAEEMSKKAMHEHTEAGAKANASKLRKLIEMGMMPIIDPVDVMNRAHVIRDTMRKAGNDLKPAYASYVDIAREQLDNPGCTLTDDQIKACVSKVAPKEKTAEIILKDIHKKLEKLITGDGGIKDQSPETVQAEELIRVRLADWLAA